MRFFAIASVLFTAAIGVLANPVAKRQTPQSAAVVLTDLTTTVTPLANQLYYATADNATEANLTPIINQITSAVNDAISGMNALSGQPTDVIMASVDGGSILGASAIADLLGAVITLVFYAINAVLLVVDSAIYSIIFSLLATLGNLLFSLISVALSLVVGLLAPLIVLLQPIFFVVDLLGLGGLVTELLGGLLGGLL